MNRIRTFIAATLLTPSLIVGSAQADMVTYTQTLSATATPVNQNLNVSQFNPTLGTLVSVEIVVSSDLIARSFGSVTTTQSGGSFTAYVAPGATQVTGPGISTATNSTSFATFYTLSNIPAGTTPFDSGSVVALTASEDTGLITSNLGQYTGPGTLSYNTQTTASANGFTSGGGNSSFTATFQTFGDASVMVTYTYTPAPVPEPSSLLLLSGLSLGLVSYRGCRKLRTYFLSRKAATETSSG